MSRNLCAIVRPGLLAVLLALGSRGASAAPNEGGTPPANAAILWGRVLLQTLSETQPGPTVAARALAIVHTCMYDAWSAYDADALGTRLGAALKRPEAERTLGNKDKAASHAAFRCMSDLFPDRAAYFGAILKRSGHDPADASESLARPAGVGHAAAQAVLAYRHRDGSNQLGDLRPGAYSDPGAYRPSNGASALADPDSWQPRSVPNGRGGMTEQAFLTPHWGTVTPFALRSGSQFRPKVPPPSLPGSILTGDRAYEEQAREVLQYAANLTDEHKMIAEYWADGPNTGSPAAHWCEFAHFVSVRDRHDLDQDVKMYFILTNAMLDTSIGVWDAKRSFDYVRPVSAINFLFAAKTVRAWGGPFLGVIDMPGRAWLPYQQVIAPTPPFPEFVSGHSAFSAAAAEILRRFTGSDVFGRMVVLPPGSSRIEPGLTPAAAVTLSWATFSDAAEQAGLSRRYGGIHFKQSDLEGRDLGRRVAAEVWREGSTLFAGGVPAEAPAPLTGQNALAGRR